MNIPSPIVTLISSIVRFFPNLGQENQDLKDRLRVLWTIIKSMVIRIGLFFESCWLGIKGSLSRKNSPNEETISLSFPATDMSDEAQFGYDVYTLIVKELEQHRKSFSKFIFDAAHADMLWEEEDYKKQFFFFAFHYFPARKAISLVFPRSNRKALTEKYQKFLKKYPTEIESKEAFYRRYSMLIMSRRRLIQYKLKKETPLLDLVRTAEEVKGYFSEAVMHGSHERMEDYDRMGYLAVFSKEVLDDSDWSLIYNLYCKGEILFDFWDFIRGSHISSSIRKKVSDKFDSYWGNRSESSARLYHDCFEQYLGVNLMGILPEQKMTTFQKIGQKLHNIRVGINR